MLALGLVLALTGFIFGFRWFAEHKFEYLDGVSPSKQMDRNFWLCIVFTVVALPLIFAGAL